MEMVDMQSSSFALKQHLQSEGAENFWSNHVNQYQYPTTRKVAMFGSTYTCKSSFSHMNAIKTRHKKLNRYLRFALTTVMFSIKHLRKLSVGMLNHLMYVNNR